MRHLYSTLLFCGLALSFVSCSGGELSRSKAKALLAPLAKVQDADPYSKVDNILVKVGTVANCGDLPSGFDPVRPSAEYSVLEQAGYIRVRPTSQKHVWDIELTELGNKSIVGGKYAHKQEGSCDQWQVTFPLAKYDHFDVTGISNDGIHARVELSAFYNITDVGMAVRKVADAAVLQADPNPFLEPKETIRLGVRILMGDSIADLPAGSDKYQVQETCQFTRYDDGWRVDRAQNVLGIRVQ